MTSPTADVDNTPVNPITSAGAIEPTEDVVLSPVKPTTMFAISTEPTEEVELTPVKVKVGEETIDKEPVDDVALNPVKPITSAGEIVPTLDVKPTPVKLTLIPSCDPQEFWFQGRRPHVSASNVFTVPPIPECAVQ